MHFGVDRVVAVPHAHRDDPAEEVQILVAVRVPDILVLGPHYYQRFLVEVENAGKQEFLVGENDFFFRHETPPSRPWSREPCQALTRDSYMSGRRSRKNCHVLRTSAISPRSSAA